MAKAVAILQVGAMVRVMVVKIIISVILIVLVMLLVKNASKQWTLSRAYSAPTVLKGLVGEASPLRLAVLGIQDYTVEGTSLSWP